MKISESIRLKLVAWAETKIDADKPDRIISRDDGPYMKRWYVIPKNPLFNIYLHYFLQSDEDRALHDHPWYNCSILIKGFYKEHLPHGFVKPRSQGHIYFRSPWSAHRVELRREIKGGMKKDHRGIFCFTFIKGNNLPVITLFITGPIMRRWGFLCPKGWRYHREFTKMDGNVSSVGKGCN